MINTEATVDSQVSVSDINRFPQRFMISYALYFRGVFEIINAMETKSLRETL